MALPGVANTTYTYSTTPAYKPAAKVPEDGTLFTANKFIDWLVERAISVTSVCLGAYDQNAELAGKSVASINVAIKKVAPGTKPYGGMVGQTAAILQAFDPTILPSDIEKVFGLLKATGRIHQVGSGKGKGLILFSKTPITASEYVEKSMNTDDAVSLSKALKDAVSVIVSDNKILKDQVEKLTVEVTDKDHTIQRLNSEINLKYKTSWT